LAIDHLEFPLAKAEYLFKHSTAPGEGGDKQKFWRTILGFDNPEAIREAILAQVALDQLEPTAPNQYGERYQSLILIQGPSGVIWRIKTIWIVLTGEDIVRFVTAVPERFGRQS
jgi:hypothetical protein